MDEEIFLIEKLFFLFVFYNKKITVFKEINIDILFFYSIFSKILIKLKSNVIIIYNIFILIY